MPWQYKIVEFCEIPFTGYFLKTQFIFQQFKGNNSLHTGAILTKCKLHPCVMVIYIKCKFQRILYICHLVTTESDNFKLN